MKTEKLSILFPWQDRITYRRLSEETQHDLGLDSLCRQAGTTPQEQRLIRQTLSSLTDSPEVANFRSAVFQDILTHRAMREKMLEQLRRIEVLQEYGGLRSGSDKTLGVWDLMHRLDEVRSYIRCIEALRDCLSGEDIASEGLTELLQSVNEIYEEHDFAALKADVDSLKPDINSIRSVTLGVNLNERFEAVSMGLISVNGKAFTKSGVISGFADALLNRDHIRREADWNESYHYYPADGRAGVPAGLEKAARAAMVTRNPLLGMTLASVPADTGARDVMQGMDTAASAMLTATAKHLRSVLNRYVGVTVQDIIGLIPEFLYYIRMAEFVEKKQAEGWRFCRAHATADGGMRARGFYNLKLMDAIPAAEAVPNDLDFDREKRLYILTGANRGGKTTLTQAVGQLFVLAQGGVSVPADSLEFTPADVICTHFPADEDKTLDLGRLGEECKRFRELYAACGARSLMLLNETFSTTSFEEGYRIALDACRALLKKGVRTVYNTHMHKLAACLDQVNGDGGEAKALSLVAVSEGGRRSFRVKPGPPEGTSMARDIAEKYGVTFEQLTAGNP